MIKVNKVKLVIEEVEQFDDISFEDLVEGVFVSASPSPLGLMMEFGQSYRKTPQGSSSYPMNTTTVMGENPSRSFSSIGLPPQVRLGYRLCTQARS